MARRERERFTERNRPTRRPGDDGDDDIVIRGPSLKNPGVLVGLGAVAVAIALLLAMLATRKPQEAATTDGTGTPAVAASGEGTAEAPAAADATEAAPAEPAGLPGKTFAAPEDQKLDPVGKAYFATIKTAKGDIRMQLFPDVAPKHVNSFIFLSRQGFYDGLTIHRVDPGFVIQGGDPAGNGTGGPGYSVDGEFNEDKPVPHRGGTLAMARSGDPNSAGSQFYIVLDDGPAASSLDGKYTVFGHVLSGMDVVRATAIGDVMESVTIEELPASASEISADDIRDDKRPEGGR